MPNFLEQFKKAGKSVNLKAEEKNQIRGALEVYIQNNPVRIQGVERQLSQRSLFSQILRYKFMPIIAIILAAALAGGGVSAAAEASLPGDLLYPVKVSVNEEVRAALSLSAEAKANWDARRAERRLEEAERLSSRGELDAEKRARLEERFTAHAERVNDRIREFQSRENHPVAAEVAARFETSLSAHQRILGRLVTEVEANGQVEPIRAKAQAVASAAADARVRSEAAVAARVNGDIRPAAEGKLGAVENKLAEARRFVERVKATTGAEAAVEAEAKLSAAEGLITEGKAKMEAEAYGEAFVLFQKALRAAQEAKLLIQGERLLLETKAGIGASIRARVDGDLEGESELRAQPTRERIVPAVPAVPTGIRVRTETEAETETAAPAITGCCVSNSCTISNGATQCRRSGGVVDNSCNESNVGERCGSAETEASVESRVEVEVR